MNWFELEQEARRQGKVGYFNWSGAKRDGVDPASLVEKERELASRLRREKQEYERYVFSEGHANSSEAERVEDDPNEHFVRKGELERVIRDLIAANVDIGLKMPEL